MVWVIIKVFLVHVDPARHDLNCFCMQQFHCVVASFTNDDESHYKKKTIQAIWPMTYQQFKYATEFKYTKSLTCKI